MKMDISLEMSKNGSIPTRRRFLAFRLLESKNHRGLKMYREEGIHGEMAHVHTPAKAVHGHLGYAVLLTQHAAVRQVDVVGIGGI